jgi:tRNA (cmo5U34)-methyltransferase
MIETNDNKTPHKSSEYDIKVRRTIPFYECFHQQAIDLIKTVNPDVKKWLDTGCGTGYLVEKAIPVFKDCIFTLTDPSSEMLMIAEKRLKDYKNIEYLDPVGTENMELVRQKEYDVITAIQTHHYLNRKDRIKATRNCYKLLKDNGIYVTFENIRPENDKMIGFQLDRWMNFQLMEGRSKKDVAEHRKRFGVKYFPMKVSDHLKLLNSIGFRIVEIFWLSYLQAGFFCIK